MEFKRDIIFTLKKWKDSPNRKPILLGGARQVGKTWIMESFGRECFENFVKFDFDKQHEIQQIFQTTKDPYRILKELALYSGKPIQPEKTLLIFDEIQECEEALNSLKYFCDEAPQYAVIAAGSLLGVAVKRKSMSVPLGKVRRMRLFPLTFREFLRTSDPLLFERIENGEPFAPLPRYNLNRIEEEYRRFQICGGMPEAAKTLLENRGMDEVENTLQDILDLYELDFAKYAAPREIPRISAIWHSLPSQLSKENRKFIYNVIRSGARSKDYEDALLWLQDAGMIYKLNVATKPGMPLSAYLKHNIFKVYACDCGLLRRLARLSPSVILDDIYNFTEFKGALAENTVYQNLIPAMEYETMGYWTSEGKAEVDFLLQIEQEVVPLEVKAGSNLSGKSLFSYKEKFHPNLMVRLAMGNISLKDNFLAYPLGLAPWLPQRLRSLPKE